MECRSVSVRIVPDESDQPPRVSSTCSSRRAIPWSGACTLWVGCGLSRLLVTARGSDPPALTPTVAALIRLGGGSLVRYPEGSPSPIAPRRPPPRLNKPQPSDRRSGLFAASGWRISWVDEEDGAAPRDGGSRSSPRVGEAVDASELPLRVELPGQSFCSSVWRGRQLINLDNVASGNIWQDDDYHR
jgi:hypothetical protein